MAGPGILVVDRYKAYQAVDKVKSGLIVLAFCRAACVRGDFLAMVRSWPDQEAWAMGWVERIGELYRLNDQRLEVAMTWPLSRRPTGIFAAVTAFGARGEAELAAPDLHPAPRSPGEPGESLDRPDGLRRAPRGADGQQHGGAIGTRAGGGSEELLR